MLVMLVACAVHMFVRMGHCLVRMHMLVALRQMQRDPDRHQHARGGERQRHGLAKHQDRDPGPEERRDGKIRAGACGAELAQADHEEGQARTVAREADQRGGGHRGQRRPCRAERQRQHQVGRTRGEATRTDVPALTNAAT